MRSPIRIALFALLANSAWAQTPPEVGEILKKVSEAYKASSRYEFEIDATGPGGGNGAPNNAPYTRRVQYPG